MTRLSTPDIVDISSDLTDYDADLVNKTGHNLTGIACRAAGISENKIRKILPELSIGVIPVTGGQGIISRFCDTLVSIISHMGGRAFNVSMRAKYEALHRGPAVEEKACTTFSATVRVCTATRAVF